MEPETDPVDDPDEFRVIERVETVMDVQLREKNRVAREYYEANKDKLRAARKKKEVAKRLEKCIEMGIPDYLLPYIRFRANGSIELVFKDKSELLKVLVNLKFKVNYTQDLAK